MSLALLALILFMIFVTCFSVMCLSVKGGDWFVSVFLSSSMGSSRFLGMVCVVL